MRISDWSSDVCSSDLVERVQRVNCSPGPVCRLRIKDDDVVGRRPTVVAGIPNEVVVNPVEGLPATVEGDMEAAALRWRRHLETRVFAGLRNVQITDAVQAGTHVVLIEELALISEGHTSEIQ